MKFGQFKILIETLEKIRDRSDSIQDFGINLMDYDEDYHKLITLLLRSVFNEEGEDWINWYLYERVGFDGKILEAWDEKGNVICHNVESLWDTVKPYRNQ